MTPPDPPLVSLIIATYNRWPMVAEAIESALAVDQAALAEFIVVDDGSTDGTGQWIHERYPLVSLVSQENLERGAARNAGAECARGRFLNFIDSDDAPEPWHISQFAAALAQPGNADRALFSAPITVSSDSSDAGTVIRPSRGTQRNAKRAALLGTCLPLPGLFIPREAFFALGGFPEAREIASSEDWVLLAGLIARLDLRFLHRASVLVREHSGRSMHDSDKVVRSRQAAMNLLLEKGLDGQSLREGDERLVIAGTHRLCAAHLYADGRMREAREHLKLARSAAGWLRGLPFTARLSVQSWLGPRGARAVRDLRCRVRAFRS